MITCDLDPCFYTNLAKASNTHNTPELIKLVTKKDKYIDEVLNIKQETPIEFVKNVNEFIDNLYNTDSINSAIDKIKDQIDKEKDEKTKNRHTKYVTTARTNLSNFSKNLSLIDEILDHLNIFTKEINKKFTDNSYKEIEGYQKNRTKIKNIETSGFKTSETN
jgi:RPA family protein